MKKGLLATLRRLTAVLILAATGIPAGLELANHPAGSDLTGVHLESATRQHHSDHCLSSMAPSERSTPTAAVPDLVIQVCTRMPDVVQAAGVIDHHPRQPTRSRAPPTVIV